MSADTDPDTVVNVSDATLAELRAEAADLGIEGRSKMDRDELVGAIASANANVVPPGTPEETGRPELVELAEARAANRNPRRLGATN